MQLEKRENAITGECLYYGKHQSGLDVYIMPRKEYSKGYAIFGTRYGSVDSEFIVPGETEITKVPDGIAHYLEHKMFDQPDNSNIFDQFSKLGANANAFTSFNMTAYLYSATSNMLENLAVLLDYVQTPYFTKESVQKEQGIIGQEIRMYDDNAEWKVFFNFLNCLYQKHPARLEIAGTIESISHIDEDYLYKCYNTFYNLSNMMLFVTGDINVDETLAVIEKNIKKNEPFDEEIKRIYPEEPDSVAASYKEQKLSVSMPIFMLGFKDNDVGYSGKKLLKKIIEMNILLEMILGKGTKLYNELYESGLINNSLGMEYNPQIDYGYSAISGESKDPQKVYDMLLNDIKRLERDGLSEEDFKRIKKVIWGDYIRLYNDVEDYAHAFLSMTFMDIDYFDYFAVYQDVSFEDVQKRFNQHFKKDLSALSVIYPI